MLASIVICTNQDVLHDFLIILLFGTTEQCKQPPIDGLLIPAQQETL